MNIHGGITYCEIEGCDGQKAIDKWYNNKTKKTAEEESRVVEKAEKEKMNNKDKIKLFNNMMAKREELRKEYINKLKACPNGYVIFGFDCSHYNDHKNPMLKDVNHVMMLTEQMEIQLREFAKVYSEYIGTPDIGKDYIQRTIINNIRSKADIQCDKGFGEVLDILSGKQEPD